MSETVADIVLQRLREWGVRQVFGYPGDGINGLLSAWVRAENDPQFVQSRHEEMSAFQAVGYAKFSGEVGVCAATSGPGGIHLLNGLYDAKLDHVPVFALVGQTERSAMGGAYQQEIDMLALYKDVCSDFVQVCMVPEQLPNLIDRAIRIALAERAPTALIFPSDVLDLTYEPPRQAFKQVPSSLGVTSATPAPDPDAVSRAAEILNSGERVAMLVGQGARGCAPEHHGCGHPRRRLRESPSRARCPPRHAAVGHGIHRPARHDGQPSIDVGLRHPADRRIEFPVLAVPSVVRTGQGSADRPFTRDDRHALPE